MTASSSGSDTLKVGSAEIRAGVDAPSGVAIFGFRQNNVLISELGIPASTPRLKGRVPAEVAGPVNTGLAISNPNDSAVTVSFFLTNADGQDFGAGSFNLPAHGQIARLLDQAPFNITRPSNATLTFSSTLPVAAIALRGFTNERSEFLITSLPIADPDGTTPGTSFFPHVADGGGWVTRFILINPSDFMTAGKLTLNVNGQSLNTITYSIPPRSSRQFSTDGSSAEVRVGSAKVTADLSSVAPIGVAVFSFKQAGVTVSEAGVSSEPAGKAFRMYAEIGTAGAVQTGVAIMNSSSTEERIEFQLTRLDGVSAGLTGSLVIPALGQRALFLNQIPGLQSLSAFKGILRISSANQAGLVVVGLRGRSNERGDFLITTTPPVNENASPNAAVVFPHIVDGDGYTTQFITFAGTNTEPASGTLQLFSQTGGSLNVTVR